MRNILQFAVSLVLLTSQVHIPFNSDVAATATSSDSAVGVYEVKLNTNTASPVELTADKPDFDTEVLQPLRVAQAEAAKAKAARKKVVRKTTVARAAQAPATPENFARLRYCEAGGIYTRNSGNGYYGAYQYNLGTWGNFMGYARPDLAPPAVQDEKARITQAARGWAPWPACARKLGLM